MKAKAVDAIPEDLQRPYLEAMKERGAYWYDMARLALVFGMRNIEVRELKADQINLSNFTLTLTDSKQVRAYVTKYGNRHIQTAWMTEGRKFLRREIGGDLAPLLVRMATSPEQLRALADEYDLLTEYEEARQEHYRANIEQARAEAMRTAPHARQIDFSQYPEAKKILQARIQKYSHLGGYLFPCCELNANRARGKGFEPVSRQSVYRVIKEVEAKIKADSKRQREALKGVRLGLHSGRKAAVQKVANHLDIMAASLWIGHGNGSGDIATTQRYLDRSEKRIKSINEQLADIAETL